MSSSHLTSKLDTLMEMVEAYEEQPKKLDIKRLLEIHRDLFEGYALIGNQAEAAKAIDRRLDHYLRTSEVHSSTLRQVLLQLHATWFFFQAGGPLNLTESYDKASEQRGDMEDPGTYFRSVLVPRVLDPINSDLPARVRLELLAIIARMENESDALEIFSDQTGDEELHKIPRTHFVLGLIRRWEGQSRKNLAEQPNTIENRLLRQHRLNQMVKEDPILRSILGRGQMGYVSPPPIWERIRNAVRRFWEWIGALIIDSPGVIGRPVFYLVLGLFFIALAVATSMWVSRDNTTLMDQLDQKKGPTVGLDLERSGQETARSG